MMPPQPSLLPRQRSVDEPSPLSPPRAAQPSTARADFPRRLHSSDLLGGAREVEIEHRGSTYRLRLTSLDKLILTK
jgi:hemin uptake protein HemP